MLNCYCQVLLFLDNMMLANQNAKLTGPDQGFLFSPLASHEGPGNEVAFLTIMQPSNKSISTIVAQSIEYAFYSL